MKKNHIYQDQNNLVEREALFNIFVNFFAICIKRELDFHIYMQSVEIVQILQPLKLANPV